MVAGKGVESMPAIRREWLGSGAGAALNAVMNSASVRRDVAPLSQR